MGVVLISISLIICEVMHMVKSLCFKDHSVILKKIRISCQYLKIKSWTFHVGKNGVNILGTAINGYKILR